MWTIPRREIFFYCSCSSFKVGLGCLARSFQVDNEVQLCSSHGWSGGHCIREGKPPSLWTCWHVGGGWSMHLSSYLVPFRSIWSWQRLPWFMFLVLLKMNIVSVLFPSWRTKSAIAWTLTCRWLLQCMHINSSHLIPFHIKLPMICG